MTIVTSDVIILTLIDGNLMVGLVERDHEPFEGRLALPGVFIKETETAEDAALRAAHDKGGLKLSHIEQLRTFSGPDRDPRGWSASVAYMALIRHSDHQSLRRFAPHTGEIFFVPCSLPALRNDLPFDHALMVEEAVARLRGKGAYSTMPAAFLPEAFTVPEMREVYEAVLGQRINDSSFRKAVARLEKDGLISRSGSRAPSGASKRPASLWRINGVSTFNEKIG